jgi:hypothetical protein
MEVRRLAPRDVEVHDKVLDNKGRALRHWLSVRRTLLQRARPSHGHSGLQLRCPSRLLLGLDHPCQAPEPKGAAS